MRKSVYFSAASVICGVGLTLASCNGVDAPETENSPQTLDGFYNSKQAWAELLSPESTPRTLIRGPDDEGAEFEMQTREYVYVKSCEDLRALDRDKVHGSNNNWHRFRSAEAGCKAAEVYLDGVDANVSFMRGMDFESLIADLPSETAPQVSMTPQPSGGVIGSFYGAYKSETLSENIVRTEYDGFEVDYRKQVLRDLNKDGIEDMLLLTVVTIPGATYKSANAIAITKKSADGPIELLWIYR